jgi:very-short-patch-repair endonuclease
MNMDVPNSRRAILCPSAIMLQRARELRKQQTPEERKLWTVLRNRGLDGYKFKRQVPIDIFIVDFLCEEANLIIELDGGQHLEQEEYDTARTQFLKENGFRVIRFWNNDVKNFFNAVIEAIQLALKH